LLNELRALEVTTLLTEEMRELFGAEVQSPSRAYRDSGTC